MQPCNKERELGILAEQYKNMVETNKRIEKKLDDFIEKCDTTYATKDELNMVRSDISSGNQRKVARIQSWGGIIAGILGLAGVLVAVLTK